MPDLKISALPAVTAPASTDEFAVNQGAVSKKVTLALLDEFLSDKGVDVASAGIIAIGEGILFHITGTTTITDIDFTRSYDGRVACLIFDASLLLTYNATSLILPGKVNIQTAPGDSCWVVVDSGDNVKVLSYERADGEELVRPQNQSVASQAMTVNGVSYFDGSSLLVPPSGLRVGSRFYWSLAVAKTGAGTAAKSVLVKLGTAGTTADATILTFALPVGTGVIDEGIIDMEVVIRGPLGAACIAQGYLRMMHRLTSTGLINTAAQVLFGTSAGFTSSTAALKIGLALSSGLNEAWTASIVTAGSENV